MNADERRAWERGQEQILAELFYVIDLIESVTPNTGNGRAKKRALQEVVRLMCGEGDFAWYEKQKVALESAQEEPLCVTTDMTAGVNGAKQKAESSDPAR
jgi:hypothetical protein